jgi:ABC-type bacteriocin/lantibiotic exporter with double-glycine peptidase domain
VSAFILSFILALTAAAQPGPLDSAQPPPPPTHRIADVPLVERNTNWCGPAALAAVLRYHGEEIAAAEIAGDIYLPHYRGSLNLDLLIFARKRGFEVWANASSDDAMRRSIARDRPVICMVRRGNVVARRNHYVVVSGYDSERRVWFLDSGNGREETFTEADFEREWAECGHWMLVVEGKKPTTPAPSLPDEED